MDLSWRYGLKNIFFRNKTFLVFQDRKLKLSASVWKINFVKPHKVSTYSAHSDNFFLHFLVVWLSWNFVRFQEIHFQIDAKSFSFLSWKIRKFYSKKIFFDRCQYQNKKALFTDSIFRKGFDLYHEWFGHWHSELFVCLKCQ